MKLFISVLVVIGMSSGNALAAFSASKNETVLWISLCASGKKIPFPINDSPGHPGPEKFSPCHAICTKNEDVID